MIYRDISFLINKVELIIIIVQNANAEENTQLQIHGNKDR